MLNQIFKLFLGLLVFCSCNIFAQDFSFFVKAGELARIKGDYKQAFENYDAAFELAEKADDKSKQARIFIHRGHIFYIQGQYLDAIRSFRQAEKSANFVKDNREEARAWAFLGQLYWRVGKVEDSERLLQNALRIFEKTNDEINIALVLRFMGRLEDGKPLLPNSVRQKNDGGISQKSKNALAYYERSLAISSKIGDEEGELTTLKEIGLTYQGQNEMPQFLEKALNYFEPLRIRLKNSDYRRLYSIVLNNLATNAERRKDFEKAHQFADEAIIIFRELGDLQELREMLDTKARIYSKTTKNSDDAAPFVNESVKLSRELFQQPIGDMLDRQRYFESLIVAYRNKIVFAHHRNRPDEMLETLEEMRSWVLLEMMRKSSSKIALTVDESLEEKAFTDELGKINRQIVRARQSMQRNTARIKILNENLQNTRLLYEEWQAEIASKYQTPQTGNEVKPLSFGQMCETLPDEKTAIIEVENLKYSPIQLFILTKAETNFDGKNELYEFKTAKINLPKGQVCSLITFFPTNWATIEGENLNTELHRRINEFQRQVSENSPSFKKNSQFLYDILLADALSMLKNVNHLVFAPGGNASNVPFQALMNENGRYLIEDFAISYAPSMTVLAEMQSNRQKLSTQIYEGDFLAFGNPKLSGETIARFRSRYRDRKLGNLPEAETEVREIAKFYPKNKVVIGKDATEKFWQTNAANYRILHLATHGLSDSEKPLYSHVLLSADATQDGLIEAREISEMDLRAEMVVLSACETARGREIDGEGMIGLAWSFAAAGTPTILASNWKVDSSATADLMIDFYSTLNKNPELSKAEALQKAILKKLENPNTKEPFYWAGFALYGDWLTSGKK